MSRARPLPFKCCAVISDVDGTLVTEGDGGNDVAMFERSRLSIATGNASPEVQQAADFVTDNNREEGFANAVERFILGGDHTDTRVGMTLSGFRA